MKTRTERAALAIALMMLLGRSLPLVAQETVWEIGPRSLPASVGVSEVFRESLLKTPVPDVAAAKAIVLRTDDQWEAWAREGDVPSAATARRLAEALSVAIREDKIAGVKGDETRKPGTIE